MLKVAGVLAAFAMALIFTGCPGSANNAFSDPSKTGGSSQEESKNGVITGKILYQDGVEDCSGIDVFLEKLSSDGRSAAIDASYSSGRAATATFYKITETAEDGSYSFNELPDGNYTVYASNGDEAAYRSVTISEGSTVTVEDLSLVLKGSISGTLEVNGGSAAGSLVGVAGTSYLAFVAEDGSFKISGIPAGTVKLCAMTNGKYQAFDTEYEVDGKTTAAAGIISVTLESENENSTSYVTVYPTERGVYFSGTIPSAITLSDNSNPLTNANCSITIFNYTTGISMHKDWSLDSNSWGDWNITYPLVDAEKEYAFGVKVQWHGWTYYEENFTITATGGLGEYKIENADDYDVELTEDRVIQNTGKPEFTDNDNVKVKRLGINYSIYKYKEKPANFWDGGTWVYETAVYDDYDTLPLKDLYYICGWRDFDYVDRILSGNWYGVRAWTKLEIAGYSDDDNIYFY